MSPGISISGSENGLWIQLGFGWSRPKEASLCCRRIEREYYGASVGVSGERQKFLRLLQNENESIAPWETRVRNQAARCEYEDFADELMRDQFIAGLTFDTLRVKLIGKGHKHKNTAQTKVTLRESCRSCQNVRSDCVRESAHENCQEHTTGTSEFTSKSAFANPRQNLKPVQQLSQCFWCGGNHQQPRQQHCHREPSHPFRAWIKDEPTFIARVLCFVAAILNF